MKKFLFLLIAISFLFLLPFVEKVEAAGGKATLTWTANTEADLAGYKVYMGTATRTYGTPVTIGKVTTHILTIPADGTYFFAVTAIDVSGNESGFSNEVSKTIDSTPPAPPSGLQVLIEKIIAFFRRLFGNLAVG